MESGSASNTTHVREYDISHPQQATVVESTRITPLQSDIEVRHIVLEIAGGGLHFVEGQSIGVLPPGPHPFGNDAHLRLYSIASSRRGESDDNTTISICVRRCFYVDEISGERYPGIASNYLCDALPGDIIAITGPYGHQFSVPSDPTCNVLMIGVGTGIAPFRAFIKHILGARQGWTGQVRLFYGARTGMETLYLNDIRRDIGQYYDKETFKAFEAFSPRPHFDLPAELDRLLIDNAIDIWNLVNDPKTHVYIAGLEEAAAAFEKAMVTIAGSEKSWLELREKLSEEKRISMLLY
ncbi:MAG TPA: oxidoreductase [Candidatus Hydrogenedentes bacterium]|nr:oxidoreductase [Candidatus Hydrogenedentota bacterium]